MYYFLTVEDDLLLRSVMRVRISQMANTDFLSLTMGRAELSSKELHADGALAL